MNLRIEKRLNYIKLEKLKNKIPSNDYNKWACDMLEFIATKEGWEESETKFFKVFFKI